MLAAICGAICSTIAENTCLAGSDDANTLNKIQSQNLAAICGAICSTPAENTCSAGSDDANTLNKIQSQNLAAICRAICSTPAENTCSAGSDDANTLNKIQSQNLISPVAVPYIHPLMRQSALWMSQKRLQMCTESLGSETGTNDSDESGWFTTSSTAKVAMENTGPQEDFSEAMNGRKELLSSTNFHCTGRRSPPRSIPPSHPSIACRNGPFIQMRPHRLDGRLVVTVSTVPLQNYLHACRHEGRLVLSFFDTASSHQSSSTGITSIEPEVQPNYGTQIKEPQYVNLGDEDEQKVDEEKEEDEVEDEEKEEEELEVVDIGPVVEVKVSTQPRKERSGIKMLQSSIVIKKIVRGAPPSIRNRSPAGSFFYHRHTGVCRAQPKCYLKQAAFSIQKTKTECDPVQDAAVRRTPAAHFHLGAKRHCCILKNLLSDKAYGLSNPSFLIY